MRCEDVQDQASAWLDQELSGGEAREIAEHEAGCAGCHAFITDLRLVLGEVARSGREPAPPGLESRVSAALARERRGGMLSPFPAMPWWRGLTQQAASLAAVCLLSVFGTWAVLRQPEGTSTARHDVVAAHVRSLLQDSPTQVLSSDQHTVRPWFNGKVEFAPPVKDLAEEGFKLIGGRLDYVDGHRVAALVYRRRLHTISVFVWPEAVAPLTAVQLRESGLNALSWSKDGMVWWAVSDLDPAELRELRALL